MYTFRRDDGTNTVRMQCTAASSVYITDKARRIDLNVSEFGKEVASIEEFVSNSLKVPVMHGGVHDKEILKGVKIPCKYGHVIIPITNDKGCRITTFDIAPGDKLCVVMELKTVWCINDQSGLTWVLQSIKKS
jgi:hypothetical protein